MEILKIHHVAVICSDYARSKDFYTRILGLPIIHETYRADRASHKLDLQVGADTQIEMFSFPDPPARLTSPEARGLRHLAFAVPDLAGAVAELQAQGIAVEPIRVDAL